MLKRVEWRVIGALVRVVGGEGKSWGSLVRFERVRNGRWKWEVERDELYE